MTDPQETAQLRQQLLAEEMQSKLTFGKYKGETIGSMINTNPSYLVWAFNNVEFFTLSTPVLAEAMAAKAAKEKPTPTYKLPYDPLDDYEEDHMTVFDMLDDY